MAIRKYLTDQAWRLKNSRDALDGALALALAGFIILVVGLIVLPFSESLLGRIAIGSVMFVVPCSFTPMDVFTGIGTIFRTRTGRASELAR